ncbi:hypothetical protein ES705_31812 [subsurface metagenome]
MEKDEFEKMCQKAGEFFRSSAFFTPRSLFASKIK